MGLGRNDVKKAWKASQLVTGGEALGQNIESISPAPAWKAVHWRLIVLPSRQRVACYPLIPRASPPVTQSIALQA